MLDETIASAQHNNSESLLALIEKFKPLLKKYAYKLHYEDAYYDLQLLYSDYSDNQFRCTKAKE